MSTEVSILNDHGLSVVLSSQKMKKKPLHEKKPLAQFTAQIIAQMLFWDSTCTSMCSRSALCISSLTQNIKKMSIKGSRFNEIKYILMLKDI